MEESIEEVMKNPKACDFIYIKLTEIQYQLLMRIMQTAKAMTGLYDKKDRGVLSNIFAKFLKAYRKQQEVLADLENYKLKEKP